jgi:hypothetical protein
VKCAKRGIKEIGFEFLIAVSAGKIREEFVAQRQQSLCCLRATGGTKNDQT